MQGCYTSFMKPVGKPHDVKGKELGRLLGLQRMILRVAKKRGVQMSKKYAKRLAVAHMGLIDTDDFKEIEKEFGTQNKFTEGVKSALPKYRNN